MTSIMKHKILSIIGVGLLLLTLGACREQSDTLVSYGHQDQLAFGEAETSFAGKFKVLWNGLNQNYALWDYERELGLDWDAIYDQYLPQFEALDKLEEVTDAQLSKLLKEVVSPLHDGHMVVKVKNHKTGEYISIVPAAPSRVFGCPQYPSHAEILRQEGQWRDRARRGWHPYLFGVLYRQ